MKNNKVIILLLVFLTLGMFSQVKGQSYEHLIMYGQSLSTGQQSWPPLSTTAVSNNFMIGNQVWTNYNNPVTNALNPLISTLALDYFSSQPKTISGQESCECPIVGAANYIQIKKGGTTKLIASSCGFGGQTVEQLSKEYYNPIRYTDFTNCITYASNITANSIHCPAIFWMQGEWNYFDTPISFIASNGLENGGIATGDKARYKSLMLILKNNMQNDIKAKYVQTDKPLFITYQVGKQFTKGIDMPIGMAQLEAANEYDDIVCAGPVYYLPDRGGHLDPNGYRWYGEMLGKVYYIKNVLGEDFKPLQPMEISRSSTNARLVSIKFIVRQLPLVLDDKLTEKSGDYGFQLYLDGTKVNLSSVTINNDCVELISKINLIGDIEVVYAGKDSWGKGNLRDSDPALGYSNYLDLDKKVNNTFVFERDASVTSLHPSTAEPKDANGQTIYDKPYPLYNFSLAFYYKLTKDDHSYVVPNLTPNTPFVNVAGINFEQTTFSLDVGSSFAITPTITPNNATNTSLLWTSDNPKIVSVAKGVVTARGKGNATIYATSVDNLKSASCIVTCNAVPETTFPIGSELTIPSTIQFENYNTGGEGTAYHVANSGNIVSAYRPLDMVDIQNCVEGGYNLFSTSAGEWFNYTVNVPTTQTYNLGIRYSCTSTGKVHFEVDGVVVSNNIYLSSTYSGSKELYKTLNSTISLTKGLQTIKFVIDRSNTSFNYFSLSIPTGLDSPVFHKDISFILYPNPANDFINFEFTSNISKNVTCKVIDLDGKTITSQSYKIKEGKNIQKLNIENIPKGAYIVSLISDNKVSNKKIIINR